MRKLATLLIATSMIVMVLAGFVGCTEAEMHALQGTLQNIDSVSGNVTVKLKDGSTRTFNFADVKVETIRDALGSASLEIGDQVIIKANKNGEVKRLEVRKAEAEGVIKVIGTDNVTITIEKKREITLHVTSSTKIRTGDNGAATLTDLKVGQKIEAKYDVNSKNALSISVKMKREAENEDRNGEEAGHVIHSDNRTVDSNNRENWQNRSGNHHSGEDD